MLETQNGPTRQGRQPAARPDDFTQAEAPTSSNTQPDDVVGEKPQRPNRKHTPDGARVAWMPSAT